MELYEIKPLACAFAGSNPVSPHNNLIRGDIQVVKGGGPLK